MIFFKKKTNSEYTNEQHKLNHLTTKSSERILFEELEDSSSRVAQLVDEMKLGNPIVVNFEKLNLSVANKFLSFLAGATYASDGKFVEIHTKIYMFARNIDFLDGSLDEFIKNL